jgi:hypothetical protein
MLALLAAAPPAVTRAQQPATADELNQAVVRFAFRYEGGNARLVAGRVPDDLAPNFYAAPGTRVLGTIVGGSSAVVLATTTASADSLREQYRRALGPRGWKPWDAPTQGGFVGSMAESPLVFCREGSHLHITYRRRATPPHDLQLEYREGAGMCADHRSARRAQFVTTSDPQFPTLRTPEPPPGRPSHRCFSLSSEPFSGSMGTGTTVSTDLQPAELLQHFGRQLEASGWSPPGPSGSRATVSGTWTKRDSSEVAQIVTVDVTERVAGSGCYDVRMKLAR